MGTNANILLYVTLGTASLTIPFDFNNSSMEIKECSNLGLSIEDLTNTIFPSPSLYSSMIKDREDIDIIFDFSKKVINQSVSLEKKYADVVNKYFWELV